MQEFDVVIVGGGHAGAQAAISLRQLNYEGSIAIIGEEHALPYERPPLSKEYLAGGKAFDRILIRPATFWNQRNVTMLLGHRVSVVDAGSHTVRAESGLTVRYRALVWAAGGAPRRLTCPGNDLSGIHTVRTYLDADRVLGDLGGVNTIVVVGGGYIGLEAAAVLTKFGKKVILLEALDRVLARVAGEPLSRFYEQEHRNHGVDVRLNAQVTSISGSDTVTGVLLADGEWIRCEMVIVGIGIEPAIQPLLSAGAKGGNGVMVDRHCRTSLPDVYAIGDCALHDNRYARGASIRVESVQNAVDQASVAAKTVSGLDASYDAIPWFWSNQFDLRLQTIGLSLAYDDIVVRGDPATRSFSLIYLKAGHVIALDCVNATPDYVQGRKLVMTGAMVVRERLADVSAPLKDAA